MKRLEIRAFAIASGLVWGGAILLVALLNLLRASYGLAFLEVVASIYPGYHAGMGLGSAVTGAFYGLVDGVVGGALFAWIHNMFAAGRDADSP